MTADLQIMPTVRLFLFLLCLCPASSAETRRALLVGIDRYAQPVEGGQAPLSERTKARLKQIQGKPSRSAISPLDGAVNDVRQMRDLLVRKYHLRPENIRVLTNEEATADRILETLQSFLVDAAQAGDQSLFFYAGHGSRIRNLATQNLSGMDSTIIAADSALGVPDIRSKELARIYAKAPAKGVQLTVVQDSCHSGGGARGILPGGKRRVEEPDARIAVRETLEGQNPEEQGVLVLSASQDYQPAQEISSDSGKHGAFTWALLTALETSAENERIDRIFQRTRALMQSKVNDQEPVIVQLRGRAERGLFGQPAETGGPAATAAVGFLNREKGLVELNSGVTLGLRAGCELRGVGPAVAGVRIRVTEVNGPSSANTAVVSGAISSVEVGQLFQIDRWVAPPEEFLRVYVGATLPLSRLGAAMQLVADLRKIAGLVVVGDPSEATPTHILYWTGRYWSVVDNRIRREILSASETPTAAQVAKAAGARAQIAVLIPAADELKAKLELDANAKYPVVVVVDTPERADYALIGSAPGGTTLQYAWIRPAETRADLARESSEAERNGARAALAAWPQRSEWVSFAGGAAEKAAASLNENLSGLARIGGWLRLRTPVPEDSFPYDLALRDRETGRISGIDLMGDREYKLVLQRRTGAPNKAEASRRVYIFAIDSFGKGTLVFPLHGNLGNEFPRTKNSAGQYELPEEIDVTAKASDIIVAKPYGIDTYFLLTSVQPIDNPEAVFNFDGVRTRASGGAGLSRLLSERATGARSAASAVPTNWSIDSVAFRSVAPQ